MDLTAGHYDFFGTGAVGEAATLAYRVLFENAEGSAAHKTRRLIRNMFPQLADRLDSVAVDESGRPILTMRGNKQTFLDMLEHRVRNEFFHDGANIKFEPGVARIAYGELNMENRNEDSHKIGILRNIIKLISDGHADEYDADLNRMTFDALNERFGATVKAVDDKTKSELASMKYEKSDYVIEPIPDFKTAKKYAKFTRPNTWCITHMKDMWDAYTGKGMNRVYFCHRPGFEKLKAKEGNNCPLDEYGLSLISVIVDPFGNYRAVTTRWNHANGGSDKAMDAKELSKLLGGNVFELCPPPPMPEKHIVRVGENGVRIGNQVWMCKNLDIDDGEGGITSNPAHPEYGCYYTWEAAMRVSENIKGWHLPTLEEWNEIADCRGGDGVGGTKLKADHGWLGGGNGFDEYGLAILPGGCHQGAFACVGYQAYFWTADESGDTYTDTGSFYAQKATFDSGPSAYYGYASKKYELLNVRLVKDS